MSERSPSQAPVLNRRTFIKGLIGVGAALGIPGCAPQSSEPQPTTLGTTTPSSSSTEVPTTASLPRQTTTENPTTTENTTTTTVERVFASPEQKVRVEAVEESMAKFFQLTKQQVVDYHETTNFVPYVSGFSMIKNYPAPDDNSYRMLGINLGTIPVQTGDTTAALEAIGYITFQGDRFVQLFIQDVNDPELLKRFPTIKTNAGANFWGPIDKVGAISTYGIDSHHQTDAKPDPDKMIVGSENLINALNDPGQIGAPIVVEYGTDNSTFFGQAGYDYEQNPNLAPVTGGIYQATKTRKLDEALSKYTADELALIGVVVTPSIPDNLLKYSDSKQMMGTLPFGGYLFFLDQAPHII